MTFAERIRNTIKAGETSPATGLVRLCEALAGLSRILARAADLAPQPAVADQLRQLAAGETAAAARLVDALKELGATMPGREKDDLPAPGESHWARLVQALELERQTRLQLLESAVRHKESHPELATVLDRLANEKAAAIDLVRDLAVRADPQALD